MSMSMSFSLELNQRLEMRQSQRVSLADMFGETAGDIPMYSLHRISSRLNPQSIGLHATIVGILKRALIAANERYRVESGNAKWYCLTSTNLEQAITAVDLRLAEITGAASAMPAEAPRRSAVAQASLDTQRAHAVQTIKQWFETNYTDLLYDMDGKIPWPIVLRLRKKLGGWIASTAAEPFGQDIGDMVLEVARAEGYEGDDAEEAWEFMGGKLMNRKPRRT